MSAALAVPGCRLTVKVVPRARRASIEAPDDGPVTVRLTAAPVDGAANRALVELLAHALDVPRTAVRIAAGPRARLKIVDIDGCSIDEARSRLASISSRKPA